MKNIKRNKCEWSRRNKENEIEYRKQRETEMGVKSMKINGSDLDEIEEKGISSESRRYRQEMLYVGIINM